MEKQVLVLHQSIQNTSGTPLKLYDLSCQKFDFYFRRNNLKLHLNVNIEVPNYTLDGAWMQNVIGKG